MEEDGTDNDKEWLAARNAEWFADKGKYAMYYIDHGESKIYFYEKRDDFPSRPDIWYSGESIGTWSPKSNTFMWSCDNTYWPERSSEISRAAKRWFDGNGAPKVKCLPVGSLDLAWSVVSIAARMSNVTAVYNAPSTFAELKDELEEAGVKVNRKNRNKIINYLFFAITGEKNVIEKDGRR